MSLKRKSMEEDCKETVSDRPLKQARLSSESSDESYDSGDEYSHDCDGDRSYSSQNNDNNESERSRWIGDNQEPQFKYMDLPTEMQGHVNSFCMTSMLFVSKSVLPTIFSSINEDWLLGANFKQMTLVIYSVDRFLRYAFDTPLSFNFDMKPYACKRAMYIVKTIEKYNLFEKMKDQYHLYTSAEQFAITSIDYYNLVKRLNGTIHKIEWGAMKDWIEKHWCEVSGIRPQLGLVTIKKSFLRYTDTRFQTLFCMEEKSRLASVVTSLLDRVAEFGDHGYVELLVKEGYISRKTYNMMCSCHPMLAPTFETIDEASPELCCNPHTMKALLEKRLYGRTKDFWIDFIEKIVHLLKSNQFTARWKLEAYKILLEFFPCSRTIADDLLSLTVASSERSNNPGMFGVDENVHWDFGMFDYVPGKMKSRRTPRVKRPLYIENVEQFVTYLRGINIKPRNRNQLYEDILESAVVLDHKWFEKLFDELSGSHCAIEDSKSTDSIFKAELHQELRHHLYLKSFNIENLLRTCLQMDRPDALAVILHRTQIIKSYQAKGLDSTSFFIFKSAMYFEAIECMELLFKSDDELRFTVSDVITMDSKNIIRAFPYGTAVDILQSTSYLIALDRKSPVVSFTDKTINTLIKLFTEFNMQSSMIANMTADVEMLVNVSTITEFDIKLRLIDRNCTNAFAEKTFELLTKVHSDLIATYIRRGLITDKLAAIFINYLKKTSSFSTYMHETKLTEALFSGVSADTALRFIEYALESEKHLIFVHLIKVATATLGNPKTLVRGVTQLIVSYVASCTKMSTAERFLGIIDDFESGYDTMKVRAGFYITEIKNWIWYAPVEQVEYILSVIDPNVDRFISIKFGIDIRKSLTERRLESMIEQTRAEIINLGNVLHRGHWEQRK